MRPSMVLMQGEFSGRNLIFWLFALGFGNKLVLWLSDATLPQWLAKTWALLAVLSL